MKKTVCSGEGIKKQEKRFQFLKRICIIDLYRSVDIIHRFYNVVRMGGDTNGLQKIVSGMAGKTIL